MELILTQHLQQLLQNGSEKNRDKDHYPVVKLFTPDANCTWLITEIDPDDDDSAFALCDMGMGYPELGWLSLSRLTHVRGQLGIPIERDIHFEGKYPVSIYLKASRLCGTVIEGQEILDAFAANYEGLHAVDFKGAKCTALKSQGKDKPEGGKNYNFE